MTLAATGEAGIFEASLFFTKTTFMSADQFYFSKEKLRALLDLYDSPEFQKSVGGRPFRGLLITPGKTDEGKTGAFGFGLFGATSTLNATAESADTIICPNTDPNYMGCPVPPGCP